LTEGFSKGCGCDNSSSAWPAADPMRLSLKNAIAVALLAARILTFGEI
jgi:hypothetical protein